MSAVQSLSLARLAEELGEHREERIAQSGRLVPVCERRRERAQESRRHVAELGGEGAHDL